MIEAEGKVHPAVRGVYIQKLTLLGTFISFVIHRLRKQSLYEPII
jgi:hypothetical protein